MNLFLEQVRKDVRATIFNLNDGAELITYDGVETPAQVRRVGEVEQQTGLYSWEVEVEIMKEDVPAFRDGAPVLIEGVIYATIRTIQESEVTRRDGCVKV